MSKWKEIVRCFLLAHLLHRCISIIVPFALAVKNPLVIIKTDVNFHPMVIDILIRM